jgi:hypothetical protein
MLDLMTSRIGDIEVLEVFIRLETTKGHLYHDLMRQFPQPTSIQRVWRNLYEKGYQNAAVLTFIKGELELEPEVSRVESFGMETQQLYRLLRLVERCARRVRTGRMTLDEAFRIAVKLNTCGIDRLYSQILDSVDPGVVKMATHALRPIENGLDQLKGAIQTYGADKTIVNKLQRDGRKRNKVQGNKN